MLARAALAVLLGWMPVMVLAGFASEGDALKAVMGDLAFHARSGVAVAVLVLAEAICLPRLGAIALHFRHAGFVPDASIARFETLVASTRRLVGADSAEAAALAVAYGSVAILVFSVPHTDVPPWYFDGTARSPAGWWHMLVSAPLLFVLLIGWAWRVALWARFLWIVARLDLRLVPSHPDRVAGLAFVGNSMRAFSPVAFAFGAIAAGTAANGVMMNGEPLSSYQHLALGATAFALLVFTAPLLAFGAVLLEAWGRGVMEYGALAAGVGRVFEREWLEHPKRVEESALEAQAFSATTDLYQVVSNVYQMRYVPFDLMSFIGLAVAALLPFGVVVLFAVPFDALLAAIAGLML